MARIFAYCDSPTAPTGFGRSALHVLKAFHAEGHEIVQLAVNHIPGSEAVIPWKVYAPTDRGNDPYGFNDLARILVTERPFDACWTTFDPQCPFGERVGGVQPPTSVYQLLIGLKQANPGFRMLGWFPIDGGPLSDFEMQVLSDPAGFDVSATMATHVHDIIVQTAKLKGYAVDRAKVAERVKVVPHGVDLDAYKVATDEQRREAKRLLGFPQDCFLIVQVERNQPRKLPMNGLDLLARVRAMKGGERAYLYQHMHPDEESQGCRMGFRMPELAWRYGLKAGVDVRWIPGRPFSDAEMVGVTYAAADVVFSGSSGEGFQYPLWEALACGRRVLAPDDSARAAWLKYTPGAFLYESEHDSLVMRGGYNRRMNTPNVADAARIVRKMLEGSRKYDETSEASRAFVARTAPVAAVQRWWVVQLNEQLAALAAERAAQRVVVAEKGDVVLGLRGYNAADLLATLPALRAFRAWASAQGRKVTAALPPDGLHQFADWLGVADLYQVQPSVPLGDLGVDVRDLTGLVAEKAADALGLSPAEATDRGLRVEPPQGLTERATALLGERYGVSPGECVALALDGLAPPLVASLAEQVARNLGLTPIILGGRPVPCEKVGVLNLAGKADGQGALGILATVAAVVADKAGTGADVAGLLGRPLIAVGCEPRYGVAALVPTYSAHAVIQAIRDALPEREIPAPASLEV